MIRIRKGLYINPTQIVSIEEKCTQTQTKQEYAYLFMAFRKIGLIISEDEYKSLLYRFIPPEEIIKEKTNE